MAELAYALDLKSNARLGIEGSNPSWSIQSTIIMNEETKPRVIRKGTDYFVDGLGKVTILEALDPALAEEAGEPLKVYQGFAVIGAQVGPQMAQFPVEFVFENVNSLSDAFDKFQEQATENFKRNMDEARKSAQEQQNKLVVPGSEGIPNLRVED